MKQNFAVWKFAKCL